MSIYKELATLLERGLIDQATADRLEVYFSEKESNTGNRLLLAFGALGAILISLGVILIFAHNWDDLSRTTKVILAFTPLVISQGLCAYSLWRKPDNQIWSEVSAVLLFFSVGASIALVSQIYHISGDLPSFLFTWAILVIPIIYLLRSVLASILYLGGITWYVLLTSFKGPETDPLHFWWMLAAVLPFYIWLFRQKPGSNGLAFHNWLIPISASFGVTGVVFEAEEMIGPMFCSLFGLCYLIGHSHYFRNFRLLKNGFKIVGALGVLAVLLTYSFHWPWKELMQMSEIGKLLFSPEGIFTGLLFMASFGFLLSTYRGNNRIALKPLSFVFIIFPIFFFIGFGAPHFSQIAVNFLVLIVGIMTINEGGEQNHLGIINYGMFIIAALVLCRFFDSNLDFVFRGVLFVLVGLGFFGVNYWHLKGKKNEA